VDLPKLVWRGGQGLIRSLADANLKIQFGYLPLVGDAKKLLEFVDLCDRRFKELEALQRSGLRRTRELFRGSATTVPGPQFLVNSSPSQCLVYAKRSKYTYVRTWGHTKWKPTGQFPATDRTQLVRARRAVLGFNDNPSAAVWEVIPWSWLIDWYFNVGTYLNAQRNIVPCEHDPVELMTERVTATTDTVSQSNDFPGAFPVGSRIFTGRISKSRRNAAVSLSARLPALSLRQLSILGSLAILGKKGRRYVLTN
jgi:hypothetical protein